LMKPPSRNSCGISRTRWRRENVRHRRLQRNRRQRRKGLLDSMKQLTVIATNRPGLLADIAKTLGDRGVNIEALDVEGIDEHGLIVLAVDRYDEALRALRDAGYTAGT